MFDDNLQIILDRLCHNLKRDVLVQDHLNDIRINLGIDRAVLYYFYREWSGRVTCESVKSKDLSIFGSTGPDDCFNSEYAKLYQEGRVKGIVDIETEPIQVCHRDFLRSLKVRANLVAPVLINGRLWGLLIAHHCTGPRNWSLSELEFMDKKAKIMATYPTIRDHY
jgi:GAF domain-containing protein